MKPMVRITLAVVLVFAGLTVVQAQQRDPGVGAGDVDVGGINVSFGFATSSGPSGENPRGHIVIDWGDGAAQYTVECLAVSANRALVGGSGPQGNVVIVVEDHGEPGAGIDRISFGIGTCDLLPASDSEPTVIARGNIQVQDAKALDK